MANLQNLTTANELIEYRVDNTVDPDEQNDNEGAIRAKLNTVITTLNDGSVVETGKAQTFTQQQTFTSGVKTAVIDPLTTNGNVNFNTTGQVYKGGVVSGNQLQSLTEVNTLISTLTGTSFTLVNGGVQTSDFIASPNTLYYVSGASGNVKVTLPASPVSGQVVGFINYLEDFLVNGNEFRIVSASHNVQGGTATDGDPEVVTDFYAIYLIYDTSSGWYRL